MQNTFEFIESSHLPLSFSVRDTLHSAALLWTISKPDWQMKHLNDYNNTRLRLQQWDRALSKDTLRDQYSPSVKNDCIDLGYLKLFYTLSLNKSSSCKYWRPSLNTENFLHLFLARNRGSFCFVPVKKDRIYLTFIWRVAHSQVGGYNWYITSRQGL